MKKLVGKYKIIDKPGYCDKSDKERRQAWVDFFKRNKEKYDCCVNMMLITRDGNDVYKIAKECGYDVQSKTKGMVHFKRLSKKVSNFIRA